MSIKNGKYLHYVIIQDYTLKKDIVNDIENAVNGGVETTYRFLMLMIKKKLRFFYFSVNYNHGYPA